MLLRARSPKLQFVNLTHDASPAVSPFMARHQRWDSPQALSQLPTLFLCVGGWRLGARHSGLREWHEDPDWVQDLCESLPYRELFRYRFKGRGHINVLECRVCKSWLKHSAKTCGASWVCWTAVSLWVQRQRAGAAARHSPEC